MKRWFRNCVQWLKGLSFQTGVIVACLCVLCYAISFGQMLLPISTVLKGVLWVVFFGLAKTFQYTAILILGKAGVQKLRKYFKRDVQALEQDSQAD